MFANSPASDPRLDRYDHVIVHVTATGPDDDFDDHDIDRIHKQMGFSSCGYNALIKRDGSWLDSDGGALTRGIGNQGAHVGGCGAGWNGRSFGISLVGGVDDNNRPEFNMTDAQMRTLERGIARFLSLHPNGASGVKIMGHRDLIRLTDAVVKKACPCFDVIPWWAARQDGAIDIDDTPDEGDTSLISTLVDQPPFWTVASGDTLGQIIGVTGISLPEVLTLNPEISDPNLISIGQVIRLR